jgi:hypothetical protein
MEAWKRILVPTACAAALAGGLLYLGTRSRPCPLAARFDRQTNGFGVFVITNRSPTALQFFTLTEPRTNGSWPAHPVGTVFPYTGAESIAALASKEIMVSLPRDGTSVRLSIVCDEPWSRWETLRWSASVWFQDHNMRFWENSFPRGSRPTRF